MAHLPSRAMEDGCPAADWERLFYDITENDLFSTMWELTGGLVSHNERVESLSWEFKHLVAPPATSEALLTESGYLHPQQP